MTPEELDSYLTEQRVLRLATVGTDGWPHVVPLWFLWDDGVFFVHNLRRSRRTPYCARGRRRLHAQSGPRALELGGHARQGP